MNVFLEQLDRSKPQLVPLVLMSNKMLCLARITRKDEFVEEKVQKVSQKNRNDTYISNVFLLYSESGSRYIKNVA